MQLTDARVQKLDGRTVAVNVDQCPQRTACLNARNKHSLFLTVDAEMHITRCGHIIEENVVAFAEAFVERLGPVAGTIGQIGTRVLGQTVTQAGRIVVGETESNDAAPVVGDLREFDVDPLVGLDRSGAEGDALAEALVALGHCAIAADANVVAVHLVELERWQIVGAGTAGGGAGSCLEERAKTKSISL